MPYVPQAQDEGFGMIKAALRDYIVADLSAHGLPSVIELLPTGAASVLDEGFMTATTPTPVILVATVGDGESDDVGENTLVRFIVYVVDRGRGLSIIERVLHRLRRRLNTTQVALDFMTLPYSSGLSILHLKASGSTASVSLPAWKAEARAVYLFIDVKGLESDF